MGRKQTVRSWHRSHPFEWPEVVRKRRSAFGAQYQGRVVVQQGLSCSSEASTHDASGEPPLELIVSLPMSSVDGAEREYPVPSIMTTKD